jgi:hypothetical protein
LRADDEVHGPKTRPLGGAGVQVRHFRSETDEGALRLLCPCALPEDPPLGGSLRPEYGSGMGDQSVARTALKNGIELVTGEVHRLTIAPADAFRLEVETAFFQTSSSVFLPEVPAPPPENGTAKSVDFSNEAVWSEIKASTEAFATAARTGAFGPDADGDGQGAIEPGLPVIVAALRFLDQHLEHRLVVAGHTDTTGGEELNEELSSPWTGPSWLVSESRQIRFRPT